MIYEEALHAKFCVKSCCNVIRTKGLCSIVECGGCRFRVKAFLAPIKELYELLCHRVKVRRLRRRSPRRKTNHILACQIDPAWALGMLLDPNNKPTEILKIS